MAAGYVEEEEIWKCPKHPSKRKRNGICPTCLRDRLVGLCPDCANVRPCACAASTRTSSSSSSSSGRVSSLIDGEPSFRRSRSVAFPSFLRSHTRKVKTPSFLSILRRNKTKRNDGTEAKNDDVSILDENEENFGSSNRIEDFARLITRSRSVSVGTTSGFGRGDVTSSPAKGKFWQFPSPMKVFRSSKFPKFVVQDRSPLHRG